ncbi:hypothetical protein HN832_04245 [archaeon]|jgi:hypothetical protein|nr:hypothetical protein [archaeon]MBT4373395.1 hypothetical protein [archaeon]MBT4531843.1 hypothetical protein [archaeon]MBT7001510.1 hypothetical protein [archaeon]MBT7282598.1 hypothetical protein [archaeon]
MKKSEFDAIRKKYFAERERLESIKRGDLVYEQGACGIGGRPDYHASIVIHTFVDEDYLKVLDVSQSNRVRMLKINYLTEEELIQIEMVSQESIGENYQEYSEQIQRVLKGEFDQD